ncbi:AAA family ATPase [Selenomonas montiformis]|uniref:AAA family ATPase n=1 Tax=Selenomonas montiformis TaxID=2652285 RepID=UPI003F893711
MEYIEKILYRKVNASDFKKLYNIGIPDGGGGQRYIDFTGVEIYDLEEFLSFGEIKDSGLYDDRYNFERPIYTIKAYVLGHNMGNVRQTTRRTNELLYGSRLYLEFAPRNHRKNYKISNQSMNYKHPAWETDNGFPEPLTDENGNYIENFDGIIDNLVVFIIRTSYHKYYAGYLNVNEMPDNWYTNIGLENMFVSAHNNPTNCRGLISLEDYNIQFVNSLCNPFGAREHNPASEHQIFLENENRVSGAENIILYGVPGAGKSHTISTQYISDENYIERIVFHPDYTYSDFVGQILPVEENGVVSYKFVAGAFTELLKKAFEDREHRYYLIIEELNRGNAPAIFGDLFQLLDRKEEENNDGYPIGTSSYGVSNADIAKYVYKNKNHKVRIPSNMVILATMNTSDQNVFTLDTAFQRRWQMRIIKNDFTSDEAFGDTSILDTDVTWRHFCTIINDLILSCNADGVSTEDKRLGTHFINRNDLTFDEANNQEAVLHNRRFAEKVIKYLWDDVFRFDRSVLFDVDNLNSLEMVIDTFSNNEENERFNIFVSDIYNAIINHQNR